jgi:hypothetical protein
VEYSTLDLESEGPKPNVGIPLPAIELEARYYVTLLARAAEKEVDTLESLAKKLNSEGRPNEASQLLADAIAIKDRIIPRFREQLPIHFPTGEQLEKMVRGTLWKDVNYAFAGLDKIESPETLRDTIATRKEGLVRELARRSLNLALRSAHQGHMLGRQEYQTRPASIVHTSLSEDAGDV